jgi:hypothetical protein
MLSRLRSSELYRQLYSVVDSVDIKPNRGVVCKSGPSEGLFMETVAGDGN